MYAYFAVTYLAPSGFSFHAYTGTSKAHQKKKKKLRAVVFRGTEGRISYETNASLIQMIISEGKKAPPKIFEWTLFLIYQLPKICILTNLDLIFEQTHQKAR